MEAGVLAQRTIFEAEAGVAARLELDEALADLHPGGCFPLVEDPRHTDRALLIGMMVLRPADQAWNPAPWPATDLAAAVAAPRNWCTHVDGLRGSWPVSASNAVDAFRLALQYGTVDAVMAGATTVAGEGVMSAAWKGHLWLPEVPLSWPSLAPWRDELSRAIAATRQQWQREGVLSARRRPAQVAVTSGRDPAPGGRDLLDARIFRERHDDGSAIEAWILTTEEGEDSLRRRARRRGLDVDGRLLVASPPGRPDLLDVARVPRLLRERLGACLVEHDGGAASLLPFVEEGAVRQLNLTLMRRRSVRDVVVSSPRVADGERGPLLAAWADRARTLPTPAGALPAAWQPVHAVEECGAGAEAVVVSFRTR